VMSGSSSTINKLGLSGAAIFITPYSANRCRRIDIVPEMALACYGGGV